MLTVQLYVPSVRQENLPPPLVPQCAASAALAHFPLQRALLDVTVAGLDITVQHMAILSVQPVNLVRILQQVPQAVTFALPAATCQKALSSAFFAMQGASQQVEVLYQLLHAPFVGQGPILRDVGKQAVYNAKQGSLAQLLVLIPRLHALGAARANFQTLDHQPVLTSANIEQGQH